MMMTMTTIVVGEGRHSTVPSTLLSTLPSTLISTLPSTLLSTLIPKLPSLLLALVALSVARADTFSAPGTLKFCPPLKEYALIYETENPSLLSKIFNREYAHICQHRSLFKSVLIDVVRLNDQVDLRNWYTRKGPREKLFDRRRMKQAIRFLARTIFSLGELGQNKETRRLAIEFYEKTQALPYEKRSYYYFTLEAQRCLAKVAPDYLLNLLKRPEFDGPTLALLALLRHSRLPIEDKEIKEVIDQKDERFAVLLLNYLRDDDYRLSYLKRHFDLLPHWTRYNRLSRSRDLVNGLASFKIGRDELEKLRLENRLDYLELGSVYVFVLPEEKIEKRRLLFHLAKLKKSAELIRKANAAFGPKEPVWALHVTSTPRTTAGWSANSLFINIKTLEELNTRAVSLTLLHEACEQRFVKGCFSRPLGASYINLFIERPKALLKVSLGKRVGGIYRKSRLGHPWDSEREWLAELASVYVLRDTVDEPLTRGLKSMENYLKGLR